MYVCITYNLFGNIKLFEKLQSKIDFCFSEVAVYY